MKLLAIALLLCFCLHVFAKDGDHVSFSGNISSNTDDNHKTAMNYDMQYRKTTVVSLTAGPLLPGGGFLFISTSVTASDSNGDEVHEKEHSVRSFEERDDGKKGEDDKTHDASEDHSDHGHTKSVTLVGGASIAGLNGLFTTYLAGFKTGDNKVDEFKQWNSDISGALGFVISALYSMQELDPNNNVVVNTSLAGLNWAFSQVQTDTTGTLFTVTATGSATGFSISVTFLLSSVVGKTNLAEAIVTPKTIESVINITGYSLKSTSNRIALQFLVGSGSSKISAGVGLFSGTTFSSGNYSDGSQVFFSLSDKCFVNGSTSSSPVSINSINIDARDTSFTGLSVFASVKGKYDNKMSVHIFQVVFPAGASNIVYDPTTGSGQVVTSAPVTESDSANAHTLMASYVVLVILALFYVL